MRCPPSRAPVMAPSRRQSLPQHDGASGRGPRPRPSPRPTSTPGMRHIRQSGISGPINAVRSHVDQTRCGKISCRLGTMGSARLRRQSRQREPAKSLAGKFSNASIVLPLPRTRDAPPASERRRAAGVSSPRPGPAGQAVNRPRVQGPERLGRVKGLHRENPSGWRPTTFYAGPLDADFGGRAGTGLPATSEFASSR